MVSWKEEEGIKETVVVDKKKKKIGFVIIKARRHSDKNWVSEVLQVRIQVALTCPR